MNNEEYIGGKQLSYIRELLIQVYVLFTVIHDSDASTSLAAVLDQEWEPVLKKLLAGLLFHNSQFAQYFFHDVCNRLIDRNSPELLKSVKSLISEMENWYAHYASPECYIRWFNETQSKYIFSDTASAEQVCLAFLGFIEKERLQWNTTEQMPLQWSIIFIREVKKIEVSSKWLLYRARLRKVLKQYPSNKPRT